MSNPKLAASLFGLAFSGIVAAVGYFVIYPKYQKSNLSSVRDYNRLLAAALAGPPGPAGPPFLYKPNTTVPGVMTTNSLGMRSPEISAEKKLPRILVLGDSFTFGYGLVEGEPYCDVLNARLKGTAEVVNAAVSGFEIQDSAAQFLRVVDQVKPDCVVVTFVANDLDDSRVYEAAVQYQGGYVREPSLSELPNGFFASTTNFLRLANGSGLEGDVRDKFILKYSKNTDYLPLGIGPFARSRWERYKSEFAKIVEGAKQRNARVLLMGFAPANAPIYGRLYPICKEFGVPLLCQDESLDLGSPKFHLSWDPHPNAEANRLFAERLLRGLVQEKVVSVPGVEPLAPLAPTNEMIEKWQIDALAPVRFGLMPSIVFMPRDKQANINQVVGGFEDSMGLLGARAIVLLYSERQVSKLRITAQLEGKQAESGPRDLEVYITGSTKPEKISVGREARDYDLNLTDATIEKVKHAKETFLVEADLRDPAVMALEPRARRNGIAIRILRIEIY